MRILLGFIGFFIITTAAFAGPRLPKGCSALGVQGEVLTLQSKKRTLVFIHNTTTMDLWITHPAVEFEASSNWTTKLQPDNWSALVVPEGAFTLQCIESRPGHEQQVPCEGAIGACRWKKVRLPSGSEAWIGEDKPLAELRAAIGGKGVALP